MPSAPTSFTAMYASANPPRIRSSAPPKALAPLQTPKVMQAVTDDLHGGDGEFSVALQGCEENEAQGFTQLDDRSKVVRIDAVISPSEIAPAKQRKKRQT